MRFAAAALALVALSAAAAAEAARPVRFAAEAERGGALILPLGADADLAARGTMLDAASRDAVGRALAAARFDYKKGKKLALRGIGPWSQILIVGTGSKPLGAAELHDIGGTAARETASEEGPVSLAAAGLAADAAAQIATGAALGGYAFDKYKFADPAKPRAAALDAPLTVVTSDAAAAQARFAREGRALADAVAFTRDLINEPANIVYPESFVERTRAAFRGLRNVSIEVLDVPAMERLGMGSILSVARARCARRGCWWSTIAAPAASRSRSPARASPSIRAASRSSPAAACGR